MYLQWTWPRNPWSSATRWRFAAASAAWYLGLDQSRRPRFQAATQAAFAPRFLSFGNDTPVLCPHLSLLWRPGFFFLHLTWIFELAAESSSWLAGANSVLQGRAVAAWTVTLLLGDVFLRTFAASTASLNSISITTKTAETRSFWGVGFIALVQPLFTSPTIIIITVKTMAFPAVRFRMRSPSVRQKKLRFKTKGFDF